MQGGRGLRVKFHLAATGGGKCATSRVRYAPRDWSADYKRLVWMYRDNIFVPILHFSYARPALRPSSRCRNVLRSCGVARAGDLSIPVVITTHWLPPQYNRLAARASSNFVRSRCLVDLFHLVGRSARHLSDSAARVLSEVREGRGGAEGVVLRFSLSPFVFPLHLKSMPCVLCVRGAPRARSPCHPCWPVEWAACVSIF